MPLLKKAPGTTHAPKPGSTLTGKVEGDPSASQQAAAEAHEAAAAPAAAPAPAATPAPAPASTSTAVAAAPAAGAVVESSNVSMMNHIETFKNRYKVEWNTLIRLQANNGQFINKDAKNASLGDVIQMQLLSYQDSWQVSPGSDAAEAKELVRYSDDGETTTKGENIQEHIRKCHELGYTKAKLDFRVMLVGVLLATTKDGGKAINELVQIDLSATSRSEFDRYRLGTAFKIGRGMLTKQAAEIMTMTAEIASGKDKTWTKVLFEPTILSE